MNKEEEPVHQPRRASALEAAKAVFWSFLGIRRRSDHDADATRLTPVQVVVAGVIAGIIFVVTVLMVVRLVLATHGSGS
jgi:hypothetical protein